MKPAAIWSFIAGDSKRAPVAVFVAVIVALTLTHERPPLAWGAGVIFVAIIAAGLVASVFER